MSSPAYLIFCVYSTGITYGPVQRTTPGPRISKLNKNLPTVYGRESILNLKNFKSFI